MEFDRPDDQILSRYVTPGFKPFSITYFVYIFLLSFLIHHLTNDA